MKTHFREGNSEKSPVFFFVVCKSKYFKIVIYGRASVDKSPVFSFMTNESQNTSELAKITRMERGKEERKCPLTFFPLSDKPKKFLTVKIYN